MTYVSALKLYGSRSTRSPLVNWYLLEKNIPFTEAPPRPSKHPFGQVPFLEDEGGVEVFESGECVSAPTDLEIKRLLFWVVGVWLIAHYVVYYKASPGLALSCIYPILSNTALSSSH